ncbi:MAG TPA: TonB-dependent receptor [Burkholderiaceae bacterium]|nr:TonB-dependent receptor [Burkholderiaceae bacterium]
MNCTRTKSGTALSRLPDGAWLTSVGLGVCAMLAVGHAASAENPAEALESQRVEVIGTTPLPGLGTPLKDVPANVQAYSGKELGRQRQGNLAGFLENNPTSVTANAAQGNPYQTDIAFRGFTASPLVGVPQGLSVFQDGVRINEPFGDVVNWDLLPQSAIASIQLIPGSNPLFGLNTLGGALAIYTKSGSQYPGGSVEVLGGSFGRRTLQVEQGGSSGSWDYYVTGNVSRDRGWAAHNPSRIRQFFGKVGYQTERDDLDVSLTAADNRLEGTQSLPLSFLDDRRQAYTYPDINRNQLVMLAAKGSHFVSRDVLVSGNAYARRYHNRNVSSNVNDEVGTTDSVTGAVDDVQAFNDRAAVDQTSYGAAVQLTLTQPLAGHRNQFVAGSSADAGRARFTREAQPASFDASRGAVAMGDFEPETNAFTRSRNFALYAMDSFALSDRWGLTASGRYNNARVSIRDRSGNNPELDGDHNFRRFNPAVGITFNPRADLTAYASYNEGMRAPTAMEMTCADPAAPCKLPNSFLADPPLKKVVAKTVEIGARGKSEDMNWSAAFYRTDLVDDIQFVSSGGAINAGYFQNVGKTRRMGIELTGSTKWGRLSLGARYALINASYRTGFVEHSPANSSADANGDIAVFRADRIPGIPRHTLRVRLDYLARDGLMLGMNVAANSSSRLRGDESNQDVHGAVGGYTVVNLDGSYRLTKNLELFARIDNVFDRKYANFGILGHNVFASAARTFNAANPVAEPFLGLGAPRGGWVGVRYEWE